MIRETASIRPKCHRKSEVMAHKLQPEVAKIANVAIVVNMKLRVKTATAMSAHPTLTSHDDTAEPTTRSSASARWKTSEQTNGLPNPSTERRWLSRSTLFSQASMNLFVGIPELCESKSTRK